MKKLFLAILVLIAVFASGVTFEREEIISFFDTKISEVLENFEVPGAVFSFVSNGEIVYVQGYGYSDLESKTPMKPDSLVRIGSVSKLFTWISIMQLYEQGMIDLKADVNDYVSNFRIPDTFPEPITVENLLTHTPGFEEMHSGVIQFEGYVLQPLGEALMEIPERVFEPGKFSAYSNYGAALAGYIAEEVSGTEFSDYVEQNIIEKLGMSSTTVRQTLSPDLRERMSPGYYYSDGENESLTPFEIITVPPAGSMTSSAEDMAKFTIANLQMGEFEDVRILSEETASLMQRVHFQHDPRLNGVCYGFYEMNKNGVRLIGHGGDTILFHSLLVFSPEDNWGFFVSFNSNGNGSARDALLNAFMDEFYPTDVTYEKREVSYINRLKLTGDYISNRRVFSDPVESLLYWMNPDVSVELSTNGGLVLHGSDYNFIDDDLVISENKENLVAFRTEGGRDYLFIDSAPIIAFEKVPWYLSQKLVGSVVFGLLAGLFLLLP
ncbi:MAG: serine hydrolase domain-containing protein [Thermotogota bacterium]|nr:serine hydrolase domain-containing protein [Thermotogota bacterium]